MRIKKLKNILDQNGQTQFDMSSIKERPLKRDMSPDRNLKSQLNIFNSLEEKVQKHKHYAEKLKIFGQHYLSQT